MARLGLFGIQALRTVIPTNTSTRMKGQHMMFSGFGPPLPAEEFFPSQPKIDSIAIASTIQCMYYWPRHGLGIRHIARINSQVLTQWPVVTACSGRPPRGPLSCLPLEPSHPQLVVELLFAFIPLFTPWSLLQRGTD